MSTQEEENIDTRLLLYYDRNFDQNYDQNAQLNKTITTQNQLINVNMASAERKTDWIRVLTYVLLWLIYFMIIAFGYIGGWYGSGMFYGLTIFSVFIFTYLLLRIYWWNQFIVGAIRAKDATEAAAKNVTGQIAQTVLPHFTSRQKCPSGCNTNIYPLFPPTPVSSEGPTMHTDSSHNDWLLGDLPQVQVSEGEEYETSPKPWFGPIGEEYATQYTCQWTGAGLSQNGSTSTYQGPGKSSMTASKVASQPAELVYEGPTFQTYIPCQYYPGYKTIEKKIAGQTVMSTKGV